MATSGRGRSNFSDSGLGSPGSRLGKPVYHVKKTETDSDLFTESVFVYTMKTWWARLTSRTALETYQGTLNHFVALVILTAQTMAAIVVALSKRAWVVGVQVAGVGVQVGGALMRTVFSWSRTAGGVAAGGFRTTGGAIAGSARGAWGVMSGGARATRSVVAGGARATRSAVAGGARATKGAVAGGARLTRRTIERRERKRTQSDPVSPPRQVARPPAPATRRAASAKPASEPERPAAAASPSQRAPASATKTSGRGPQPVREAATAQPRPASPGQKRAPQPAMTKAAQATPPEGARRQRGPTQAVRAAKAPGARTAGGGARPQAAAAASASLKAEQVFVGQASAKAKQKRARMRIGLATQVRQIAGVCLSVARVSAVRAWRLLLGIGSVTRRGFRLLSPVMRWASRRWQYAAIPLAVSMLAVMLAPIGWDVVGGFSWKGTPSASVESPVTIEAPAMVESPTPVASPPATAETPTAVESPSTAEPPATIESKPAGTELASRDPTASEESGAGLSLPKISFPKFSGPLITLPAITWPAFVRGPVEKVDRLLSGALVEPGSRVLIADVTDHQEEDAQLGLVLGLVLEAELAGSRHITVSQRERTLIVANGSAGTDGLALPATRALSLAGRTGSAAIITSELTVEDSARVLAVVVHDQVGDELYRFALELDSASLLDVVGQAATRLAAKLGSTGHGQPAPLLTRSLPAARAYAEARAHLYRSDYRQAIEAAGRAIAGDSAFAAAHRLMAEALSLNGQRARARQSLETAWRFRDRLNEREQLRLAADRDALAGNHSEAILGYDYLFSQFRDDVAALKCQAILQEMVGVRGGGDGNLRVAHTIDPVDWPPLERVAAFLGYRGRIPELTGRPPADSE